MVSFSRNFSARFRCFGDLLAGSMDDEGTASVVAAPFAVTLTMCHYEGKCTERGTSSLGKDTNSDLRRTVKKKKKKEIKEIKRPTAYLLYYTASKLVGDKNLKTRESIVLVCGRLDNPDVRRRRSGTLQVGSAPLCQKVQT